jgi:hypothetical protein
LAEEVALLDVKAGLYYDFNAIGAQLWNLIQQPRLISEVCEVVLEEYEVEPECCKREVLALFQELVVKGLVEVKEDRACA